MDHDGDGIHITTFNELVDLLNALIHICQLYIVKNGTVKVPNPNYNHLGHPFEIFLLSVSTMSQYIHDNQSRSSHSSHFILISSLNISNHNSTFYIVGFFSLTSTISIICQSEGSKTPNKNITMHDISGCSINVTLWGA